MCFQPNTETVTRVYYFLSTPSLLRFARPQKSFKNRINNHMTPSGGTIMGASMVSTVI